MPKSNHIDQQVLEKAGEYYLDLQDGTMDAAELKAWQGWMAQHDDHRRAFARMETLWGVLDLAGAPEKAALEGLQDAQVADNVAEKPLASGGSVLSMVAPEQAKSTAKPTYAWFGAIAASIAAAFIMGVLILGPADKSNQPAPLQYYTAAGEQRVINLADGSIVELGTNSAVQVRYSDDVRNLTLTDGEAVFTVAKNPKRPFVVRAGQGSVTAIGTVFNVRKSADNVQVRVLEGTVAVRPVDEQDERARGRANPGGASQPVALVTAGRQTEYGPTGNMAPVIVADVHEGLAWRVGVLTMVDWPISDVIQELNRYLTDEITIGDEAVGSMRFTGTVYPDQVDAWLDGLQQGYPIEVVRLGGSTILMVAEAEEETLLQ